MTEETGRLSAHICFYRTLYSQSAASVTAGVAAAAVRGAGRDVRLTLLVKGEHRTAMKILRAAPVDAVLVLKPNFQDAAESLPLANELATTGRYRAVFLMGVYAQGNAEHLLRMWPALDGVLEAEPEAALPGVLDAIESGPGWRAQPLPGVLLRTESGELRRGPRAAALGAELDLVPVRDVERMEVARLANLEASRGCTASCTFCHVPVVDRATGAPRRRFKQLDILRREILELLELGKRYLVFNDPIFWSGPADDERVGAIADMLAGLPEPVEFMVYLRTRPFPGEELLGKLAAAGLVRVFIGIESHSPETLKLYRKGASPDAYPRIRGLLDERMISHHIGFLTFNPFLRLGQLRADLEYLIQQDQVHRIGVVVERARLVPGTTLLHQTRQAGLVTGQRDPLSGDAAYGWTFQDPAVGAVHQVLRRLFQADYAGRGKYLEYHHTSTEFLWYLARRAPEHLRGCVEADWWKPLRELRGELTDLVGGLYRRLVREAAELPTATQATAAELADRLPVDRDRARIAVALSALERRTEVAAAVLVDRLVNAGLGRQVESLFTSAEGST